MSLIFINTCIHISGRRWGNHMKNRSHQDFAEVSVIEKLFFVLLCQLITQLNAFFPHLWRNPHKLLSSNLCPPRRDLYWYSLLYSSLVNLSHLLYLEGSANTMTEIIHTNKCYRKSRFLLNTAATKTEGNYGTEITNLSLFKVANNLVI